MQTAGSILSARRREKKIPLEEIHQKTKISLAYLEAIENDQYQVLGGETYVMGFLRAYARALEMDPAELLLLHGSSKKIQAQESEVREVLRTVGERTEKDAAPASPFLLKFVPREGWPLWTAVLVGAFLTAYLVYGFISGLMPKTSFYYVRSQVEAKEFAGIKDPYGALQASAIENVWVTLSVDDGPSKLFEMKKGTRQVWLGRKKFQLRVGNAGGLLLLLNNKPIGILGHSHELIPSLTIDATTGKVNFAGPAPAPPGLTRTGK